MEGHGIDAAAGGQGADGVLAQRPQREAGDGRRREVAQDGAQRMARPQLVVAVGHDQQGAGGVDAPAGVAQQVERGLIGPVDVLKDGDSRPLAQQLQERGEQGRAVAVPGQSRGQPVGVQGHVVERPERPRREQRVAGPPQHGRLAAVRAREPADQRRLAHARLAADKRHPPPAAGRVAKCVFKLPQGSIPFEKSHGWYDTLWGQRIRD